MADMVEEALECPSSFSRAARDSIITTTGPTAATDLPAEASADLAEVTAAVLAAAEEASAAVLAAEAPEAAAQEEDKQLELQIFL